MERGGFERPPAGWGPRGKIGLETPISGRFYGEMTRLVFAPPLWYDILVLACILAFPVVLLLANIPPIRNSSWQYFQTVSLLVTGAGLLGAFSNERMSVDLRGRKYARLEGQGLIKRLTRGSVAELDAVVLTAQEYPVPLASGRLVTYRLVLHWKGRKEPPLPLDREDRRIPIRAPLNVSAGFLRDKGLRYAAALAVPFYDNAHLNSGPPVPVF